MTIVTIRGLHGAGASEVGRRVAQLLRADYVDREIIEAVAERLKREPAEIVAKEEPPGTLLGRIVEALGKTPPSGPGMQGAYLATWEIPLADASYITGLEAVIKDLAKGPSVVIRGRGSQFILKDHPSACHVLVVAPLALRLAAVRNDTGVNGDEAKAEIERVDRSRKEFTQRYFHANLEDPIHYDLVINRHRLSVDAAAEIVMKALEVRGLGPAAN